MISETEIEKHLSYVVNTARGFERDRRRPTFITFDELVAAGNLALVQAARIYRVRNDHGPTRPFWVYAWPRVRGAMQREISYALKFNQWLLSPADPEKMRQRLENLARNDLYSRKTRKLMTGLATHTPYATDFTFAVWGKQMEGSDLRAQLAGGLLRGLKDRSGLVLRLFYDSKISLRAIGERLGISEGSVRRTRDRALCGIRRRLMPRLRAAELCRVNHTCLEINDKFQNKPK